MNFIQANGAKIPAIGLGTWELRGRTCARIVEQALRLGYRHIDISQDNSECDNCQSFCGQPACSFSQTCS